MKRSEWRRYVWYLGLMERKRRYEEGDLLQVTKSGVIAGPGALGQKKPPKKMEVTTSGQPGVGASFPQNWRYNTRLERKEVLLAFAHEAGAELGTKFKGSVLCVHPVHGVLWVDARNVACIKGAGGTDVAAEDDDDS